MWLSDSSRSPTKRWPWNTARPVSGKAGQAIAKSVPSASISASATGPILPASVESKVEQYLKKAWRTPQARSRSSASTDCATASAAGIARDLSATTTASTLRRRVALRRDPQQLRDPQPAARQHVGEVGGAGEVVGDAAQDRGHGAAPSLGRGLAGPPAVVYRAAGSRFRNDSRGRRPRHAEIRGQHLHDVHRARVPRPFRRRRRGGVRGRRVPVPLRVARRRAEGAGSTRTGWSRRCSTRIPATGARGSAGWPPFPAARRRSRRRSSGRSTTRRSSATPASTR